MSAARFFRLTLALTAFLTACESAQKAREAARTASSPGKAAQDYASEAQTRQQKYEARRAKGDTLAIPYAELQKMLPAAVEGYTPAGEPEGESINRPGASYSTATQRYKKGNSYLQMTLIDYNGAYELYGMATAFMASGFSSEDADQKMGGIDLGVAGAQGWEVIYKKERRATLSVGVADRFFVTAEADHQADSEVLKKMVKHLDLRKLSTR